MLFIFMFYLYVSNAIRGLVESDIEISGVIQLIDRKVRRP